MPWQDSCPYWDERHDTVSLRAAGSLFRACFRREMFCASSSEEEEERAGRRTSQDKFCKKRRLSAIYPRPTLSGVPERFRFCFLCASVALPFYT